MTTPAHLGIDPGKSGGLAVVYSDGTAEAWKMPDTERDVLDLVRELAERWVDCEPTITVRHIPQATIEVVHAMPGQGVTSMFTFGMGYGGVRMALLACGFSLREVSPARWQTAMGCRTKGDKNVSKAKAQELFPTLRITHATADALLIARYGSEVSR